MTAKKVVLCWHCKTAKGWKRSPAAFGRDGKVRPGNARVGNAQILYPEGRYALRHSEGRRTDWTRQDKVEV